MHPGLMLTLVTRIVVCAVSGTLLLSKWLKTSKRFFSDFPFILSATFFTLACAKLVDLHIGLNFSRDSPDEYFVGWILARYVLMAFNITEMLVLVLIIWFRSKRAVQALLITSYAVAWTILFMTSPDYETMSKTGTALMIPVIAFVLLTFIFIHHQKRLGNKFNTRLIIYGLVIYTASQLVRPLFMTAGTDEWGYLWISELLDLGAWLLIFYAFFMPTRKSIKIAAPASGIHA